MKDITKQISENDIRTLEPFLSNRAKSVCMEIYLDYDRKDVLTFSSGIQRAWKIGKLISEGEKNQDKG